MRGFNFWEWGQLLQGMGTFIAAVTWPLVYLVVRLAGREEKRRFLRKRVSNTNKGEGLKDARAGS